MLFLNWGFFEGQEYLTVCLPACLSDYLPTYLPIYHLSISLFNYALSTIPGTYLEFNKCLLNE